MRFRHEKPEFKDNGVQNEMIALGVFTFTRYMAVRSQTFSICYGHVDYDTFKKAFNGTGKFPGVIFMKEALFHEWWVRKGPDDWVESSKGSENALPVTVLRW